MCVCEARVSERVLWMESEHDYHGCVIYFSLFLVATLFGPALSNTSIVGVTYVIFLFFWLLLAITKTIHHRLDGRPM